MTFYNIIDEQGRFCGLKYDNKKITQTDSHTISYLGARKMLSEIEEMGLDIIEENLWSEKGVKQGLRI